MTTGQDSLTGGASPDSFFGSIVDASDISKNSFQSFDAINGGGGNDTLTLAISAAATVDGTNISNIETINARAVGVQTTFNALGMSGVTLINSDQSTGVLRITNLGSTDTAIGIKGVTTDYANGGGDTNLTNDTAGLLQATYSSSALAGSNSTVTVNVSDTGVSSTVAPVVAVVSSTTDGAENLTVVTSGSNANYIEALYALSDATNTASTTLKKLTVQGTKDLTINTALDFAGTTSATIDASAFQGALSVGIDINVAASITGGSGNDEFKFTTGLTADDTVNGGDGTDTVVVTGTDSMTLSNLKLTSIEVIDQTTSTNNAMSLTTGGAALSKVIFRENDTNSGKNMTVSDLAAGVALEVIQTTDSKSVGTVSLGLKDASGTSDALSVTLKGISTHGAADNAIADLSFSNIETLNLVSASTVSTTNLAATDANTITTITADTSLTTINASGASALTATVGSAATKLTKFDASAMTGDLSLTFASSTANDVSVTSGAGDDTLAFGASLNYKDTVIGGGNTSSTTEDTLTADVTGLTSTTGVLKVSGVERLNLTNTGTAVINAANISGATEIAIDGASTSTTITNLANGAAIGLGFKGAGATDAHGTVDLSLASETGTADSLTVNLNETADGDTNTVTLKTTSGLETLNLVYSKTATSLGSLTVTSTNLKAGTINISGSDGDNDNTVTLGTLNANTTKVDASTFKGVTSATAASGVATTFLANGGFANVLDGSTGADTFTIGSTTSAVQDIDGSSGSDTLNITVGNSSTISFATVDNFETYNITVGDSATAVISTINSTHGYNDTDLTKMVITGGNSLSSFTTGTDNTAANGAINNTSLATIDASGFKGAATLRFADDSLTSATSITGGAGNDKVYAAYSNSTNTVKMSGIENLYIDNATGATTLDVSNVTGASKVVMNDVTADVTLSSYNLNQQLQLGVGIDGTAGTDVDGSTITVTGASTSGTADALSVKVQNLGSSAALTANGIETLNLSVATDVGTGTPQSLSVSDTNATNKYVVNITDGTSTKGFTLAGLSADASVVDASNFAGDLTLSGSARAGSTAMTITGGTGNDTLAMKHFNDVIDGGTGTGDILSITQNAVLGGFQIDLSSTTDQVTSYNGSANTAVQKGFEGVNLSGITGSFGADITSISTGSNITGTSNADVINGGAGVDTIDGGSGNDVITGGAGADQLTGSAGADTITGGAGADTIAVGSADSAADTVIYTAATEGGLSVITLTNVGSAADDFTATAGTTVDSVTQFVTTSDKISIRGALRTALNSSNDPTNGTDDTAVLLTDNGNIDADTATVFIFHTDDDLIGDNFGDVSDIATTWNTTNSGTPANWNANEEVLFAVGNNTGNAYGVYYFKDVNGDGDIGAGDQLALVTIVGAAVLAATDFAFAS